MVERIQIGNSKDYLLLTITNGTNPNHLSYISTNTTTHWVKIGTIESWKKLNCSGIKFKDILKRFDSLEELLEYNQLFNWF